METFGMVDILQKRLEVGLRLIKGLILVQINFLTLQGLDKAFRECVLGGLSRGRHTDSGSDIEEALHMGMATILFPRSEWWIGPAGTTC
jgi:hypothetical protein